MTRYEKHIRDVQLLMDLYQPEQRDIIQESIDYLKEEGFENAKLSEGSIRIRLYSEVNNLAAEFIINSFDLLHSFDSKLYLNKVIEQMRNTQNKMDLGGNS